MQKKALIVIDMQNDITKNYRDVIANINKAIEWAEQNDIFVVYIKHNNLSDGTRTFKPDTRGAEFVAELKIVSDNVFIKTKSNALTSEAFALFVSEKDIKEFYLVGADAAACVKSTCYNMVKSGFVVHVFSDCVTSYNTKKLGEILSYYESKGCSVERLNSVEIKYTKQNIQG